MPEPTLEELGNERAFSFYPPLLGIEHNEWTYRKSTWSEILVHNTKSEQEILIPRRFVGELSSVDEPVMIVGLKKELEYRGGAVWPHERRVIELPRAVNQGPPRTGAESLPPLKEPSGASMRRAGGAESRIGRMMLITIGLGVVACIAVVLLLREGGPANRVSYTPVLQSDLGFTANDDYYSVVNRLGQPAEDRWRSNEGELQYRLLSYPQQGLYVVLMGPDRKDMHYIGAMDRSWHVIHSLNNNTEAMLRKLKKF